MFSHINVDACKTPGCKNLGILGSPDYLPQGKNVLCRACGFLFPIISARSLNLFRQAANQPWKGLVKSCPHCGGTSLKKYGFSTKGERRMYCRQCNKTFISYTAIRSDARQENLATLMGEGASLVEIRAALAIDSTGFSRELQKLSRRANQAERDFVFPAFDIAMSTRAHLVQRKEALTMRRNVLFDVDYGPAVLYKNDPGMLVKPVLPAYRHFELVQALTDERSLNVQHYLDHECFILGGCMMANFSYLRQGRCHISFVRERGVTPPKRDLPPRLFLSGGIRNNVWRTFSTRDYAMAVCNLTGNKKVSLLRHATLNSATAFIRYVHNHPFLPHLNRMSPGNVVAVLDYLKFEYNASRN